MRIHINKHKYTSTTYSYTYLTICVQVTISAYDDNVVEGVMSVSLNAITVASATDKFYNAFSAGTYTLTAASPTTGSIPFVTPL